MSGTIPRLLTCAAAILAAAGPLPAQEPGLMPAPVERLAPMPEQGVLVLRNGQAIEGRITRAGDLYYVALPEGEIRLKAAEVELCCRNLEEGYLRKRAAIADTVEEHLRLAQWCQRQGLLRAVAAELADARRLDPRHPMIDVLQHRLEMATEPPPKPVAAPVATGPSFESLDQMVRGLPAGTVEEFTQTIQPILMNHCSTAGCHGSQSQSRLHLLRIPDGRPATRRLTQRNLYEVLQLVDRQNPESSPLLAAAAKPHGAVRAANFNDRQGAQYQRLVKWVGEVAGHKEMQTAAASSPAAPPNPVQPAAALLPVPDGTPRETRPAGSMRATQEPGSVRETHQSHPAQGNEARSTRPAEPDAPPQQRPAVQRGAAVEAFGPRDAFDPEIFNRRYFRPAAGQTP